MGARGAAAPGPAVFWGPAIGGSGKFLTVQTDLHDTVQDSIRPR